MFFQAKGKLFFSFRAAQKKDKQTKLCCLKQVIVCHQKNDESSPPTYLSSWSSGNEHFQNTHPPNHDDVILKWSLRPGEKWKTFLKKSRTVKFSDSSTAEGQSSMKKHLTSFFNIIIFFLTIFELFVQRKYSRMQKLVVKPTPIKTLLFWSMNLK